MSLAPKAQQTPRSRKCNLSCRGLPHRSCLLLCFVQFPNRCLLFAVVLRLMFRLTVCVALASDQIIRSESEMDFDLGVRPSVCDRDSGYEPDVRRHAMELCNPRIHF